VVVGDVEAVLEVVNEEGKALGLLFDFGLYFCEVQRLIVGLYERLHYVCTIYIIICPTTFQTAISYLRKINHRFIFH
jgi:hypothetical protein